MVDGQSVLSKRNGVTKDSLLQFQLSRDESVVLLAGISAGNKLSVQFPHSNNQGGFISLAGSRSVALAFARCVAANREESQSGDRDSTSAPATFDFDFDSFRDALDSKIRADVIDKSQPDFSTTKDCNKEADEYYCSFHDAGFQSSISEFKKLDILNGKFTLKLTLLVNTFNGKVSRITLQGDRGDPVNLFQFIGTVEDIIGTFDPEAGKAPGDSAKVTAELGLMRGDNADDINRARTTIKPYAVIGCMTKDSHRTTQVECEFIPRS